MRISWPPPEAASGRCGLTGAQAEQGLERRHRRSSSIMAEHKLVEVHLQLRAADAVVRPDQPLLEVAGAGRHPMVPRDTAVNRFNLQDARLLSDEHFTVDGTLLEAWAGLKSF